MELMILDNSINYIVSGLERSGTSMIMQVLSAAKIPIAYDKTRLADNSNPNGSMNLNFASFIALSLNISVFFINKYFVKIVAIINEGNF